MEDWSLFGTRTDFNAVNFGLGRPLLGWGHLTRVHIFGYSAGQHAPFIWKASKALIGAHGLPMHAWQFANTVLLYCTQLTSQDSGSPYYVSDYVCHSYCCDKNTVVYLLRHIYPILKYVRLWETTELCSKVGLPTHQHWQSHNHKHGWFTIYILYHIAYGGRFYVASHC